MIARLFVVLPFRFVVPEGAVFKVYQFESQGYAVAFYPPVRSEIVAGHPAVDAVKVNGVSAFEADTLRVDFRKPVFERSTPGGTDPPSDFIQDTVNSFLNRTRHVTKGYQIHPIDFHHSTWNLEYLNDNGTKLEKEEGKIRGLFSSEVIKFSGSTIVPEVWDKIHELPVNYQPSRWHSLLLDSQGSFPDISLVVVLSSTALEVFISSILNRLAERGMVPVDLWNWINDRDYLKLPSTEEQFDELLKIITGHSLKEDIALWESFKNLRKARNSFVHEGEARIGNVPVTLSQVSQFLNAAKSITDLVSSWLPADMIDPDYKFDIQLQLIKNLFKPGPTGDTNV